jgi:hypothetical protein
VATDHVVHDLVPPSDLVRIGPGFTIDDDAEHQFVIGNVTCPRSGRVDHIRIGQCRNLVGGEAPERVCEYGFKVVEEVATCLSLPGE